VLLFGKPVPAFPDALDFTAFDRSRGGLNSCLRPLTLFKFAPPLLGQSIIEVTLQTVEVRRQLVLPAMRLVPDFAPRITGIPEFAQLGSRPTPALAGFKKLQALDAEPPGFWAFGFFAFDVWHGDTTHQ
jgi:hypothetical protein